ncbi:MAG: hypothetical protein DCC75_08190 [Proteobacteria bacterium]|nr:MAG: hypothetical protein DCC75_08190 [Pseudomonadota bacterium]
MSTLNFEQNPGPNVNGDASVVDRDFSYAQELHIYHYIPPGSELAYRRCLSERQELEAARLHAFKLLYQVNAKASELWLTVSRHLLENAIDALYEAIDKGLVQSTEARIIFEFRCAQNGSYYMKVSDNGTGMTEEHLRQIRAYLRGEFEGTVSRRSGVNPDLGFIGGNGKGVAILSEAVRNQGGRLEIITSTGDESTCLVQNSEDIAVERVASPCPCGTSIIIEGPKWREQTKGIPAELDSPGLQGRPVISLAAFEAVAAEVARSIGEPVAICMRPANEAGTTAIPFVNKPFRVARSDASEILVIVGPGGSVTLRDAVIDALSRTPGGTGLDAYFGISTGIPVQPPSEGAESKLLTDELRAALESGGDLSEVLGAISAHAGAAGANPDALRALMRGRR